MKKQLAKLLAALLALAMLTGCGAAKNDTPAASAGDSSAPSEGTLGTNEIAGLIDQGLSMVLCSREDGILYALYMDEDATAAYKVTAPITDEEDQALSDIYEAEDPALAEAAIMTNLTDVTVTDISDKFPTQEELDAAYVGKTLGDLEEEGYEDCGWMGDEDENSYTFFYDGPLYSISVTPQDGAITGSLDDYSQNDLRALEIASVTFNTFSYGIIEE